MPSMKTACVASAALLTLMSGCASSPPPPPLQRPPVPAEMLRPAPPSGCFVARIETILSRSPETPMPLPTDCEPASVN